MKCLLPWEGKLIKNNFGTIIEYNRPIFNDTKYKYKCAVRFSQEFDNRYSEPLYKIIFNIDYYIAFASSVEDAKNKADKILLEQGWILLTKERAEKLLLLI